MNLQIGWTVSIIALWVVVLFETGLLLLLLHALGELKQRGMLSTTTSRLSPNDAGLAIGEQAPLFVAADQDGNMVRLEDSQGQQRIVAFVSPGCSICAGAIEAFNNILQDEPRLVVLVVGDLDADQNRSYALEHKARMPILTPTRSFSKELYNVQGVPFVFVLDEAGVIRAKGAVNESVHLQQLLVMANTKASSSLVRLH